MSENPTPEPGEIQTSTDDAPVRVEVLQALVELRGSVDALAVLTIETLALLSKADPEAILQRYKDARKDFMLRHAFELHERLGGGGEPK